MELTKTSQRWMTVAAGTLCVFACLGLGRFAIGMVLPSMAKDLNLSYSQMGHLSAFNFVGYLLAVIFSGFLIGHFGNRKVIVTALLCVGISIGFMGKGSSFLLILICYTITGIGSGAANMAIMALIAGLFDTRLRGRAVGFITIGNGLAMILAGRMIPFLNTTYGTSGWRLSWFIIGIIVVFVALICFMVVRNNPLTSKEKPSVKGNLIRQPQAFWKIKTDSPEVNKNLFMLAAIFFLFGFTHVVYLTFIVTSLVNEGGYSEFEAGNFWTMLGLISLISGPLFGTLSDKTSRTKTLSIVFGFHAFSYLLVALNLTGFFLYLSIVSFAIVIWAIPGIVAALVTDYVGPEKTAHVLSFITFIFAIGQVLGPAITGYLAEITNSFASSFFLTTGLTLLAIILSALLKNLRITQKQT